MSMKSGAWSLAKYAREKNERDSIDKFTGPFENGTSDGRTQSEAILNFKRYNQLACNLSRL